jgi:uncharacterized protein YndB with AHSA1/START domain
MSVSEINAVVCETHIAAAPETVFAYLVEPTKMVRWMGIRAELDPRAAGQFAVDISNLARARGEYLEVVPPSRIVVSFGWEDDPTVPPGSTTLEITLTPDADGTRVRLVHRGLQTPEQRAQHAHGWEHYLDRLRVAGAGGDAGPDPNANPPTSPPKA